ncbi:hypothetical protein HMPREF2534_04904 [Bacteroides thetaiotaomicron]|nr:hypothetical protein HMPREF2534_04904 [Bacteroides thetaiotaomicron]
MFQSIIGYSFFIWILNNKYKANYRINKKVPMASHVSHVHYHRDFPVFIQS